MTDLAARARQILTPKQYDAWRLVVLEGMSIRKSARILGISRPSLDERMDAAYRKTAADGEFVRLMADNPMGGLGADQADVRPLERRPTASSKGQGSGGGKPRGRDSRPKAA